jgi:hypothetical protein
MKNLLGVIFKKVPPPNFMAEEFQLDKTRTRKNIKGANNSEYEFEKPEEVDEMQIDKIYQSL